MQQFNNKKVDLKEFLEKNREKYEIISEFQYKINHIAESTFSETISFIESHSDIFFSDYDSAIFFISNLEHFSLYNYKQLELIFDIAVHFDDKMKKVNITDKDYFEICTNFINSLNYLFHKELISVSTIVSFFWTPEIFINFYPEISEYDSQYAEMTINRILNSQKNRQKKIDLTNFFDLVKSNPAQHKMNRIKNYHPSVLHQSIRSDDISTFQQLLSHNNFNVNTTIEKSYYERTCTKDRCLSLIQTAALYGSEKIFKFLWMQNDIILNENLQFYAYSGRNHEIIHICEQKCSSKGVLRYAIHTHQNELVEYYLENFSDQLEKDPIEYTNVLDKFIDEIDDQNPLKKLNYEGLKDIVLSMNWELILPCLPKIVFVIENYEINSKEHISEIPTLLERSIRDTNFFKFLYGHKNESFKFSNDMLYPYILVCLGHNPNALKFLLKNENDDADTLLKLFFFLSVNFPQKAVLLLDFLKENNNTELIEYFKNSMNFNNLTNCILNSNDVNLILKTIEFFDGLLDVFRYRFLLVKFTSLTFSNRMIKVMIQKISEFLPKKIIGYLINEYKRVGIQINETES